MERRYRAFLINSSTGNSTVDFIEDPCMLSSQNLTLNNSDIFLPPCVKGPLPAGNVSFRGIGNATECRQKVSEVVRNFSPRIDEKPLPGKFVAVSVYYKVFAFFNGTNKTDLDTSKLPWRNFAILPTRRWQRIGNFWKMIRQFEKKNVSMEFWLLFIWWKCSNSTNPVGIWLVSWKRLAARMSTGRWATCSTRPPTKWPLRSQCSWWKRGFSAVFWPFLGCFCWWAAVFAWLPCSEIATTFSIRGWTANAATNPRQTSRYCREGKIEIIFDVEHHDQIWTNQVGSLTIFHICDTLNNRSSVFLFIDLFSEIFEL